MDKRTPSHDSALTFIKRETEIEKIRIQLRELQDATKYLVLVSMLSQVPFENIEERLAICKQMPQLPGYYFDYEKFAKDTGAPKILSKYNPYLKKAIAKMKRDRDAKS